VLIKRDGGGKQARCVRRDSWPASNPKIPMVWPLEVPSLLLDRLYGWESTQRAAVSD
jgi:hypothetical protein